MLLVLYTGQGDVACPVYRTGRYFIMLVLNIYNIGQKDLACPTYIQDREILVVLYTGQGNIS